MTPFLRQISYKEGEGSLEIQRGWEQSGQSERGSGKGRTKCVTFLSIPTRRLDDTKATLPSRCDNGAAVTFLKSPFPWRFAEGRV